MRNKTSQVPALPAAAFASNSKDSKIITVQPV
jgi:hypothetical protein